MKFISNLLQNKKPISSDMKEAPADQIAATLCLEMTSKIGRSSIENMITDYPEEHRKKIIFELNILDAVAFIFDIYQQISAPQERDAVLNAFLGFVAHESIDYFGQSYEEIWPVFQNRLEGYKEAWKTPHQEGPFFMIGKKFAEFTGNPSSSKISFIGATEINSQLSFSSLREILKKFRIRLE